MEAVEAGGGKVERRFQANGTATGIAPVRTRVADESPVRRSKGHHVAQVAAVLDLEQDVLVVEVEGKRTCLPCANTGTRSITVLPFTSLNPAAGAVTSRRYCQSGISGWYCSGRGSGPWSERSWSIGVGVGAGGLGFLYI
jgi:hypothetical protein